LSQKHWTLKNGLAIAKNEEHLTFDELWQILEKNKAKIGVNLKSRELFEALKTEYEKSLSKLLPLKEKLPKTGWLIDQIVYKLYGHRRIFFGVFNSTSLDLKILYAI